jgi:HEPN domain-containing protein
MSKKNENQQKQESWYITRAFLKLREAKYYSRLGKFAEAVNSSYESLEFSVKALCKMLDVHFDRKHFVDEFTVAILAEKIGRTWTRKRERLLSVLPIIMSYSDRLRAQRCWTNIT